MIEKRTVLIVDDEAGNRSKLRRTLIDEYEVYEAESGELALQVLTRQPVAAIVTDQRMPGLSGVELLRKSLRHQPDAVRIILTGYTEVDDLIDAINEGHVHSYITKPWQPEELLEVLRREMRTWELRQENADLARKLKEANQKLEKENLRLKQKVEVLEDPASKLVYKSRAMKELIALLDRVVQTDSTVLVQGETGTGKELLARYIHEHSHRREGPFMPVNCGAIPADLVESFFFGHQKGAFTGATEDRKGFFELAHEGTLFLDEIGEASLDIQVKLLRVLQEGEIFPVGAGQPRPVDVRIIASTNRNLSAMVEEGGFRQDLFFRLNVFSVHVTPLRARPEDVTPLASFFLTRYQDSLNKTVEGFHPRTLEFLNQYSWPGNVRELENEVERLVILTEPGRKIPPELLSERIRYEMPPSNGGRTELRQQLAQLERRLILEALQAHDNNKTQAAESLGITRQTIISKLKQYQDQS